MNRQWRVKAKHAPTGCRDTDGGGFDMQMKLDEYEHYGFERRLRRLASSHLRSSLLSPGPVESVSTTRPSSFILPS